MNTSKLKSAFEAVMPYLGTICIFVLLFMSTGCSGPESKPSAPIVIHDTVAKPFNMYGTGPLFNEGHETFCQREHCYSYPSEWYDCKDSSSHPYTNWEPDHNEPDPSMLAQGLPFDLEKALRDQGIPVINEPPGRAKLSSKVNTTPAAQPAVEEDEFPWWLLHALAALAVLVGLWRWATSPREAVGSTQPPMNDYGTRHNVPVPVVFVNHHEHTTSDGVISISVPSGGPNVQSEDIEIGTVKVKRTYRGAPNTHAEPRRTGH